MSRLVRAAVVAIFVRTCLLIADWVPKIRLELRPPAQMLAGKAWIAC